MSDQIFEDLKAAEIKRGIKNLTKKEVDRIIAEGSDEEFEELDRRFLSGESVLYQKQIPDYRSRIDKNIGRIEEQLRILDLITNSNFEPSVKTDLRKLIKEIEDTHPEQYFGKPEGKEN